MSSQKESVSEAMNDLAAVRSAIESVTVEKQTRARIEIPMLLQLIFGSLAFLLAGIELCTGHQMREFLHLAENDHGLLVFSAGYMAFFLVMVSGVAALIVAQSARKNKESFLVHIDRNVRTVSNLSLISDLAVKLVVLVGVIAAHHSDWVAPALFIFTGDYLIQRRLTYLSERVALACGLLSMIFGAVQIATGSSLLICPLAWFAVISLVSFTAMMNQTKAH